MTRTDSSRPSRGQAETTLPTPVPCLYRPGDPRIPHARAADFQSAFGRFRFCVHERAKSAIFRRSMTTYAASVWQGWLARTVRRAPASS